MTLYTQHEFGRWYVVGASRTGGPTYWLTPDGMRRGDQIGLDDRLEFGSARAASAAAQTMTLHGRRWFLGQSPTMGNQAQGGAA